MGIDKGLFTYDFIEILQTMSYNQLINYKNNKVRERYADLWFT